MKRLFVGLSVVLLLASAISACGSSDSSSTGATDSGSTTASSGTVPKAVYAKQATQVCQHHAAVLRSKVAQRLEGTTEAEQASAFEELNQSVFVPQIEQELEDLRQLPAPEGSEAEAQAMLDDMEAGIERLEDTQFQTVTDFSPAMDDFDKEARALGLSECSFGGA